MTSSLPARAALAVTLALSGSAAPNAMARLNLEPGPPVQGQPADPHPGVHTSQNQSATGIPPILPVPPSAQRAEIRREEQQEAQRFAYTVPSGAQYSNAATNVYPIASAPSVPGTAVRHRRSQRRV
jgi:hypothetical protein